MIKRITTWTIVPFLLVASIIPAKADVTLDDQVKIRLALVLDILLQTTRDAAENSARDATTYVLQNISTIEHSDPNLQNLQNAWFKAYADPGTLDSMVKSSVVSMSFYQIPDLLIQMSLSGIKEVPEIAEIRLEFGKVVSDAIQANLRTIGIKVVRDMDYYSGEVPVVTLANTIGKAAIEMVFAQASSHQQISQMLEKLVGVQLHPYQSPNWDLWKDLLKIFASDFQSFPVLYNLLRDAAEYRWENPIDPFSSESSLMNHLAQELRTLQERGLFAPNRQVQPPNRQAQPGSSWWCQIL